MNFRIHFTYKDGTPDSVEISGSDENEVLKKAEEWFLSRGISINECNPWSEELA